MSRPSLLEMECFVAVAEELNFSRAARRLHLSQPPLSRHIQSLEDKLSCQLLIRNTRAVRLTAEGQLFLDDARKILRHLDGAVDAIRRAKGGESTRLRIAFVGALLDEQMVRLLQRFRTNHPHCQIHLTDLPPAAQMKALISGTIDAAFIGVAPPDLPGEFEAVVWKREPLRIALPAHHRLACSQTVRFSQLMDEGWVLVSQSAAPAFRRFVDAFWTKQGATPRVVAESDRVAAVLTMVAASQGVSVVPSSVEKLIVEGVAFRPILGSKPPLLKHSCIVRVGSEGPELEAFLAELRKVSKEGTGARNSQHPG